MYHKIVSAIAFFSLIIGGCALDSDSYIPYIVCVVAGLVLLVEGRFLNEW